jgi:metallo-beta-lactamase class B
MSGTTFGNALSFLSGLALLAGCAPPATDDGQSSAGTAASTSLGVSAHVERARELANSDLTAPFEFYCVAGNARGTSRDAANIVPVRLFDNLYAVGNEDTVVYAITTSAGIILIDSGYPGTIETVIIPALMALGLDPADVRYVLLAHGHADHYGGAALFQSRYGARIGAAEADWAIIPDATSSSGTTDPMPPRRDLILREGTPVTLGDVSVMPIAIPGHTPGSLAFVFRVSDGGQAHVAGLFGGTILLTERISTEGLQQYVDSIARYLDSAADMHVDVEIQNHPVFDATPARLRALAEREAGDPHPFVMASDRYLRFWNVISECIQAEIARRSDAG